MQLIHGLNFKNIRGDILGGLTAAVVALPLALAFGETAYYDAVISNYLNNFNNINFPQKKNSLH